MIGKIRGIVCLCVFTVSVSAFAGKDEARIVGWDAVAAEGETIFLTAKVDRMSFGGTVPVNLMGQTVEFWLNDQLLAQATSKGLHAAANTTISALPVGQYWIDLKLRSEDYEQSRDARLLLQVLPVDEPILISDIDQTLCASPFMDVVRLPVEVQPALPHAVEALEAISKDFNIIYLTAREDALAAKTRDWLTFKAFPLAPVFFWDFLGDDTPMSHGEYKTQFIRNLKSHFSKVWIGVGDRETDNEAYRSNQLRSYIIPSSEMDLARPTIRVQGWDEILAHIQKYPIGSWEQDPAR